MTNIEGLLTRLEAATLRLESLAKNSVATGVAGPVAATSADAGDSQMVEAYDELLSEFLTKYVDASKTIGGLINDQAVMVEKAFKAQREFLVIVSKSKKPDMNLLQDLIKPTAQPLEEVQKIRDTNRSNKDFFNHLSVWYEAIQALSWVLIEPKPAPHVQQARESAEFYTNRVLKDFSNDEKHKTWARSTPALLNALKAFVMKFHTTGLVWNAKGGAASAAPAAAAAPSGGAPPPPGPPPPAITDFSGSKTEEPKKGQVGATASLFASINKGEGITSGLKKVTADQQTHKNPNLRGSSVVPATTSSAPAGSSVKKPVAANKPPKFALEGDKWAVEYQGETTITIDQTDFKHKVYVFNCQKTTIIVKGKINNITLDNCKKVAVVCENIIASVEVVNSQSCKAQITGKCPTVTADKTDGLQVFVSREGLNMEVLSSKSTEINIVSPGKTDDDDYVEAAMAEQLKCAWDGTKWVSSVVEHKG